MEKVIGFFILIVVFAGGVYLVNHGVQSLKFDLPISAKPFQTSDSSGGSDYSSFSGDLSYRAENRPRVRINSVRPITTYNPYTEITITADVGVGESVKVTGWTLRNDRGGSFVIPQAQEVYETGGLTRDIVLQSDERVVLYSVPNTRGDFRLNKCMGYLVNVYNMIPPLPTSCPRLGSAELSQLSAPCRNYITSLNSCAVIQTTPGFSYDDASCQYFLNKLNYSGCVDLHRRDSDFLSKEWRVWGGQELNLWQPDYDRVKLYDGSGQLVTEYKY